MTENKYQNLSKKKSIINENIKKYRKKHGISQNILLKRVNLAFYTIAKIESGSTPNPTIDTVKKFLMFSVLLLML
jgi:transcriptional regulator with XRE-family HTH domain